MTVQEAQTKYRYGNLVVLKSEHKVELKETYINGFFYKLSNATPSFTDEEITELEESQDSNTGFASWSDIKNVKE